MSAGRRAGELVELQLHGSAVAVLGVLDAEHDQERCDFRFIARSRGPVLDSGDRDVCLARFCPRRRGRLPTHRVEAIDAEAMRVAGNLGRVVLRAAVDEVGPRLGADPVVDVEVEKFAGHRSRSAW